MAFKRDFKIITLVLSVLYISALVLLAYMAEKDIIDRKKMHRIFVFFSELT